MLPDAFAEISNTASRGLRCNSNRIGLRYLSIRVVCPQLWIRKTSSCKNDHLSRPSFAGKKGPIEMDEFESVHRPKGIHTRAHTTKKSCGCRDANLILGINENFRGIRRRGAVNRGSETYPRRARFTSRDRFIVRPAVGRERLSTS